MTVTRKDLPAAPATFTPAPLTPAQADTISNLVLGGDLSKMDSQQRVAYYVQLCESLSLNPHTQPFQILKFQGKEIMYATKSCTEQLRKQQGVSVTGLEHREKGDVYLVVCTVTDATGRTDVGTGAVATTNLKGEALANAFMKAETKAKRRATLSICGLGMLDESEQDTMSHLHPEQVPLPTSPELGTSAEVVVEESPAKPAAGNAPAATASTSPAPSTTSDLSALDEAKLAGHRTRMLFARNLVEVQQIWKEAKHLQKLLVADKDAAKVRLAKQTPVEKAQADDLMREFLEQPTVGMDLSLASQAQQQDIQRLINLQTITPKEKADMLLVLRKLDEVRADQAVLKLLTVLAEREGRDNDKELRQALHRFVVNYGQQLGDDEVQRLTAQANDTGVHWYELRREIMTWKEAFAQAVAVAA